MASINISMAYLSYTSQHYRDPNGVFPHQDVAGGVEARTWPQVSAVINIKQKINLHTPGLFGLRNTSIIHCFCCHGNLRPEFGTFTKSWKLYPVITFVFKGLSSRYLAHLFFGPRDIPTIQIELKFCL